MAMALSTAKFSDLSLHRPILPFRFLSPSLRFPYQNPNPHPNPRFLHRSSKTPSAPWLHQWDPPPPPPPPPPSNNPNPSSSSIDRIVHRLRNLELETNDIKVEQKEEPALLKGDERLSDLLQRSWNRPDLPSDLNRTAMLPWERGVEYEVGGEGERGKKKRRVRAPSLAELTIEDEELRRLRKIGITLRERINVPKAGVSNEVLEKIHDAWRRLELVRLKFHEDLAYDMKTAHEIVEVWDIN